MREVAGVGDFFSGIWEGIKDLPGALKDTPGMLWKLIKTDEFKAYLRDIGAIGAGIATANPGLIAAGAYGRYEYMTGEEVPPEIKAGISAATAGEQIDWEAGLTAAGKEALARVAADNPELLGAIGEMVALAEGQVAKAKAQAVALYGASKRYQGQAQKAIAVAKYWRDRAQNKRTELF